MLIDNTLETVGQTPIIKLNKIKKHLGLKANIFLKLEYFNPFGSIKDRVGVALIEDAEKKGLISPERTILIEPTSGNTGIGIASVAAIKGYKCAIVMPENMSEERKRVIKFLGADLILTKKELNVAGSVDKVKELVASDSRYFCLGQFTNMASVVMHREKTATEIWEDLDGKVDAFINGIGTGGTITGVGSFLKKKNKNIEVVAIYPKDDPIHNLQGIGDGFIPEIMDMSLVDRKISVTNVEAYESVKMLAQIEGILAGITSGANLRAAIHLSREERYFDKNIVTVATDSLFRYLSTELFDDKMLNMKI